MHLIVFTETNYAGFKEIGQGGKSNDVTTTGMFGRGALSMYHFTDVPALVSGRFMLILDPQQEMLPKNRHRKHKAGVKIPLEAARRLCPDQLIPFDGLCDYSKDLEYYNGTLFRLPFRPAGKMTLLTESSTFVDSARVKTLLEKYYTDARKALLFLRNIKSILFQVRGKTLSSWSVSADRSEESEDDIFWRVKLSAAMENQKTSEEVWRIGTTDIEDFPTDLVNPGRGSKKISECGVAACLSHVVNDHRVFCKLPTPFESRLPISFHSSFAITGDRRTIPWEDQRRDATFSRWNYWLLTNCLPEFYLDFLKDLAPKLGAATFQFWPSNSVSGLSLSPLSLIVAKAFWQKLIDAQHIASEIYPKIALESVPIGSTATKKRAIGRTRKLHAVTSLKSAQFDLLPESTSKKLRPLWNKICPHLVRPSSKLLPNFKNADVAQHTVTLTSQYLCQLFAKDDNCILLEEFLGSIAADEGQRSKQDALEKVMLTIVPTIGIDPSSLEMLLGCRILPKLDGSLGMLSSKIEAKVWTFATTDEEQQLFYFAAYSMVDTRPFRRQLTTTSSEILRNPTEDIVKGPFNIRPLQIEDLGMLLAQPESPEDRDSWILNFWTYVNPRLQVLSKSKKVKDPEVSITITAQLRQCNLDDHPIYRFESDKDWHYITPRQFDADPYLVEPENTVHATLCKEISGLKIVDRAAVPYALAEAEFDLQSSAAFERLIRVLSGIEERIKMPTQDFLLERLKEPSIIALQLALLKYLRSGNYIESKEVLQLLPVWPSFLSSKPAQVRKYIPAKDATFCKTSNILLPWVVKALGNLVSPDIANNYATSLKALGVHVLSIKEIWNLAQQHQPRTLGDVSIDNYLKFIRELANSDIRPVTAIALDGLGTFREPLSLYDSQDELFQSAFRMEQDNRFLHKKLSKSDSDRNYWMSLGLRSSESNRAYISQDYVACAQAIQKRWQSTESRQTQDFCKDAGKVAAYLLWDQPTFREWSRETWKVLARIQLFRIDCDVSKQPTYRQSRMLQLATDKDHRCLLDLGRTADVRIIWSQLPILKKDPVSTFLESLPRRGKATAKTVYEHLKYVVGQCKQINDEELPEYVKDIQASYNYLQDDSEYAKHIPGIRQAKIFFNIDKTDTDTFSAESLELSLTSANRLYLNSPVDFGLIKVARRFLVSYEKLIQALGCNAVIQPAARVPQNSSDQNEYPMTKALNEILNLRDKQQLIDVVFEIEGRRKPAHRIFVAAVSDYCKAQFSGEWGVSLEHGATIHIKDMRFVTLSQMVDFAYTGTVDWPSVQTPPDKDDVAETLDELLDLLHATDRWLLKTLHVMTEDVILDKAEILVRADNVDAVREIARDANALGLVAHCDEFIRLNEESLVKPMRSEAQDT